MGEAKIIEYTAALIGAMGLLIIALAGAARLFTSLVKRATEGERSIQTERLAELKAANERLQTRVSDLEESHKIDQKRITDAERENSSNRKQIDTLCTQIEDLQQRVEAAEKLAQDKQIEIDRLASENKHLEKQNNDLFEANKALKIENGTYEKALALIGIERAERESMEWKPKSEESAGETNAPEIQEKKTDG